MNGSTRFPPHFISGVCALIGLLLFVLSLFDILGEYATFYALTLLLLAYLMLQIMELRRRHPDRWGLNPAVLCSILTFVLGYGISNAVFLMPSDRLLLVGLSNEISPAMVKLMWMALVASIAMWMGYWSQLATRATGENAVQRFQNSLLPRSMTPRTLTLPLLVVVSTIARMWQVNLGVYGYSGRYERFIELGSVTQYLSMAGGLGKIALVITALRFYSGRRELGSAQWFYFVLALETMWGALSGFKSGIVLPFIITLACMYIATGSLSRKWLFISLSAVLLSFPIIQPFRIVVADELEAGRGGTDISHIAGTLLSSAGGESDSAESAGTLLNLANRLNLASIGSFGIAYADEYPDGAEGDPEFLANILLAPAHALIPRLIWADKPLGNLGLWYNQVVIGAGSLSSTAMGPVTYLYFAGGTAAVFLGFFVIGLLQRLLIFWCRPWRSLPGAVLFFAMVQTITLIDSAFNSLFITMVRDLPLTMLLLFILFGTSEAGTYIAPKHRAV